LFDLSTEYYYLNQYKKSLKVCKKALSKSILVKDTLGIAKSYYYMGDGYESINKDSAYYYYQKAEKMFRLIKKNEMVSRMLFNKAYILFNGGNYIESEIMVSKALKALYKIVIKSYYLHAII
jgi:tetratricopeptide (TPR) repeat protein